MNKVEEVARALCIADGVDPDQVCHGMGIEKSKDWKGPAWQVREKKARAAIEAMREPTEAMIDAAFETRPPADLSGDTDPRKAWPAMIDVALKGEP